MRRRLVVVVLVACVCLVGTLVAACQPPAAGVATPAASSSGASTNGDRLLTDGPILERAAELLGGASTRALVEIYEFDAPQLESAVVSAHRRGLDVRVITDPSVAVSVAEAARLRAAGIPVREYPLDARSHQIDHVKLLVADATALVGGMNWGAASGHNHDYAVELKAVATVRRALEIFEQDWRFAGGLAILVAPSPAPAEASLFETAPGSEIRRELLDMLRTAGGQAIVAEVFVLTDPEVLAALAAARRSGSRVRVLLDSRQAVNLASMRQLLASGVEGRWLPMPPGAKLHAKVVLAGGRLLVGSANWSRSGLSSNHELDVETRAPAPVADYVARFEADWASAPD